MLDVNKACGSDGIPLKYMCFIRFLLIYSCHNQCCQLYLCQWLMINLITYLRNKNCLFLLASVFSKIIKVIMLGRIELFFNTNCNQLCFMKTHGTYQCIYICVNGNY